MEINRKTKERFAKLKVELSRFQVFNSRNRYTVGTQVGEGTYGQVFKAQDSVTTEFVALKKLFIKEDDKGKEKNRDGFPITAIREIEILRSLDHRNIVQLKAMISIQKEFDGMNMYMVFEYMDHDLTGVLNSSGVVYRLPHIKCLGKQLFQGLEYLHRNQIVHRDIKGANLLLNRDGFLKIADFGLARRLHIDKDSGEPMEDFEYTNRVVTLWYRSPELLLGATNYGYAVDLWSAGCILMEFYTRSAIFPGRTEINQLELIFNLCGTPTEENWPGSSELPWTSLINYNHQDRRLVAEYSDASYGISPVLVDLIDKLLALNPNKRLTAGQALDHDYFTSELPRPCEPHQLPIIDGDWHEYEGKMRKKNPAYGAETSNQYKKEGGSFIATSGNISPDFQKEDNSNLDSGRKRRINTQSKSPRDAAADSGEGPRKRSPRSRMDHIEKDLPYTTLNSWPFHRSYTRRSNSFSK